MIYIGAVDKQGHLDAGLRQLIAQQLQGLAGKNVRVKITKFVKPRSDNQNRFFHGAFLDACTQMYHDAGNIDLDEDDVKLLLKQQFGVRVRVAQPDGSEAYNLKSTADYTTVEMEDFMEKIRAHYAPFGYALPYPNEAV